MLTRLESCPSLVLAMRIIAKIIEFNHWLSHIQAIAFTINVYLRLSLMLCYTVKEDPYAASGKNIITS